MSTNFRVRSTRPNRAAIRAALGGSPESGIGRDRRRRADRVERLARILAPVQTGRLRDTIRQEAGRNQFGSYIHIVAGSTQTPYLGFVINGTEPHVIRARRAKALRFYGTGGVIVFRKSVFHPGTKPNDWLARSLTAAR